MPNMASPWPFKNSYKTNIILLILPGKPLDDIKSIFDVDMPLHQQLPNMHIEKSISEGEAQFEYNKNPFQPTHTHTATQSANQRLLFA